ncbi:MAG: transketolase family protein [Firmicutes bacterium]|jgi:transketolase|nr:transketolase family protein [Bacillota bacterium]
MGNQRAAFGEVLVEIGRENPDVVVINTDIATSTCADKFARVFPDRSFNVGVAEQNAVAAAAGLSTVGLIPIVSTYAVFATMRACEQVRTSVCYPNLNVKIVASHGGLQVGPDGVTHQGIEDMSLMRSLPNMTVIHPADDISVKKAVRAMVAMKGPVYLRVCRNDLPTLWEEKDEFVIGKGRVWREGPNDLATIFTIGFMLSRTLQAAQELEQSGIPVRVVEIHTLKPLDEELILKCAQDTKAIVTVEDHNIIGGLGSAVAEVLAEAGLGTTLARVGIRDVFAESGPFEELMDKYGLGVADIIAAVKKLV